jgi:hypothetical protein
MGHSTALELAAQAEHLVQLQHLLDLGEGHHLARGQVGPAARARRR